MKKMFLAAILAVSVLSTTTSHSQVRVNVNINVGSQPNWGPAGYDYVEYYYLPDIEVYYFVPRKQFIYLSNGRWIFAYGLPPSHKTYNLYTGYKVVINQPRAYQYFTTHRVKYAGYKGNRSQVILKNKPYHANGRGNGNGNGNGNRRGRGNH